MKKCSYAGVECEYLNKVEQETTWRMFNRLAKKYGSNFYYAIASYYKIKFCRLVTPYILLEETEQKARKIMQEIEKGLNVILDADELTDEFEERIKEELEGMKCPICRKKLYFVKESKYLNSEQWASVKAGDWYCKNCKDKNTLTGYRYFWTAKLEAKGYIE